MLQTTAGVSLRAFKPLGGDPAGRPCPVVWYGEGEGDADKRKHWKMLECGRRGVNLSRSPLLELVAPCFIIKAPLP